MDNMLTTSKTGGAGHTYIPAASWSVVSEAATGMRYMGSFSVIELKFCFRVDITVLEEMEVADLNVFDV